MPFGQLPALVIDDSTTMTQSVAIARYLAREYNLAGKDNVETALADMYVDCIADFINKSRTFWTIFAISSQNCLF